LSSNPPRRDLLADSREFLWIRTFVAHFRPLRSPFGPGDDAAIVQGRRGRFCVTTDSVIEGVHFLRPHARLQDIGYKALAVNLSDLAAMGARPDWFVCSLAVPRTFGRTEVKQLAAGMSLVAQRHRIRLIGGNFSAAKEVSISITAAGNLGGRALTRDGGRAGDWLYVSGTLGEARLGLELLRKGKRTGAAIRQLRPTPRVGLGILASGYARAAIDISDGFAQDLAHLCRASSLAAEVEVDRLPIAASLVRTLPRRQQLQFALAGGEDYELIWAVSPARGVGFERACAEKGERVTRVGQLTRGAGVHLRAGGKTLPAPRGFDHFR
jgi:thiamine-monophosphate kinase